MERCGEVGCAIPKLHGSARDELAPRFRKLAPGEVLAEVLESAQQDVVRGVGAADGAPPGGR